MSELISVLQSVKVGGGGTERRQAMTSIIRMVRAGNTQVCILASDWSNLPYVQYIDQTQASLQNIHLCF